MNWTGGTRVRHNRPSSDTSRLQKRYFAKVRAAQSSTHSVPRAGSHSILGVEDSASGHGKRKRPPIPDFDIIVPKDGDASQEAMAKRGRLLEITDGTLTPSSSAQSFRKVGRGSSGLRAKKQLLLEKDDWVCTTLARPLVLKNKDYDLRGRRRTTAVKTAGLDFCEPFPVPVHFRETRDAEREPREYNSPAHLSPERRTYLDTGEDGGRGLGRAFRNLSDGGYVQIGGSTQAGSRVATPHIFNGRDAIGSRMSNVSEETMLFNLDGRQERPETPSQPSQFPAQYKPGRKANGIFEEEYQVQNGSEDMVYYPRDSRRGYVDVADQFPSSPLAPYSQNIYNKGMLLSGNPFMADGQEPVDSLIGNIEKVIEDSSSPSTIQSTMQLRPEPVPTTPTLQIPLPPAGGNVRGNLGYQRRPHRRYPSHDHHRVLEPNRQNLFGLNRPHEGETGSTQNLSLMACASSEGASAGSGDDEEGESWMLGSNISPELHEACEANTDLLPRVSGDDWETFLGSHILAENKGAEQEDARDDTQGYLDQLGIWEKQSGDIGDQAQVESQCSDNEQECHDFYDQGQDIVPENDILNAARILDSGDLPATTASGLCISPEEDKSASWRDLLEAPLEESSRADGAVGRESFTRGQRTMDQCLDSCAVNNETTIGTSETKKAINNKPVPLLDLDGDEDRAWKVFVFAGLDDKPDQEESIEALDLPRPKLLRKSSLKPISQFSRVESPEPQLPSPPQRSSSVQPPDLQSTAGATVGSGSLPDSRDGTSVAGTPTVRRGSKFFDTVLSSSPVASLMSIEYIQPGSLGRAGRRNGEKKLIASWLGKGSAEKKGRNKRMKKGNDGGEADGEDEKDAGIDDIEEW